MSTQTQAPARPKLTPYERECLIERAGIMEYDGNMSRAEAERLAWQDHGRQKTNLKPGPLTCQPGLLWTNAVE